MDYLRQENTPKELRQIVWRYVDEETKKNMFLNQYAAELPSDIKNQILRNSRSRFTKWCRRLMRIILSNYIKTSLFYIGINAEINYAIIRCGNGPIYTIKLRFAKDGGIKNTWIVYKGEPNRNDFFLENKSLYRTKNINNLAPLFCSRFSKSCGDGWVRWKVISPFRVYEDKINIFDYMSNKRLQKLPGISKKDWLGVILERV